MNDTRLYFIKLISKVIIKLATLQGKLIRKVK